MYPVKPKTCEQQRVIKTCWSLNPPALEEDLVGKWYAVIFKDVGKKRSVKYLYIGKLIRRFLQAENGPVTAIEVHCLKHKTGSGVILEDTPAHLPPDIYMFKIEDVIAGPLHVDPLPRPSKFNVWNYEDVIELFNVVLNVDHAEWISSII